MQNKLIAGGIAGIVEVTCTHPLDYWKTILQQNKKPKLTNIYRGVLSRYIGVIPMRSVFWTTQNYGKKKFKNNSLLINGFFTGTLTASTQTIIDTPIENIKVNQIYNKNKYIKLYKGFIPNYCRNVLFCVCSTTGCLISPTYGLFTGSIIGCIISQPIDYIKTIQQTGIKPLIYNYMNGWQYRALISPISMVIGYNIFALINI